jgi:hypothetical protein
MTPVLIGLEKLQSLGEDPDERLAWNLSHGYVYSSPTAFAMAHVYLEAGEPTLWVEIIAGDMQEALFHAPTVKRVCYLRRGRLKSAQFDRLCTRLNPRPPLESSAPQPLEASPR